MNELTARQKFIINIIFEKGPLNIKDLSQQIDVSNRTISREIDAINAALKIESISIKETGSVLSLEGEEENLKALKQLLRDIPMQWLLPQEQRLILITAQLLLSDEPIKSAFFSYQLNVVEGTISLYMDKIEKWMSIRNLTLCRKRGYGIMVSGSEWVKRNVFVELIYEYKSIDELLAYIYENKKDPAVDVFFKMLFGRKLIDTSKKLMGHICGELIKMDDISYFSSLIHVLLSLKKIKMDLPINLPQYLIQDVMSSNEFSFIHKMKEYFISLNIPVFDSELVYLAVQLMGNKYIYSPDRSFKELGVSLEELSYEVVYEVEKKLNIKINCDEQLIVGLSQHFNPALFRINMGIQVKNLFVDEIKEYYGNLFDAVNYACRIIFSRYNITLSQDEIGFITMHIGSALERTSSSSNKLSALIICPNGMVAAKILSSKVKASIPNIDKIVIQSFKDWDERLDEYDLILSTVNIGTEERFKSDKIITVSPFLMKKDINNINNYIKKYLEDNHTLNNLASLSKFEVNEDSEKDKYEMVNNILKNLKIVTIETNSFNEMIGLITENIYKQGIINDRKQVESLIINREKIGSVVIPNSHLALIHTRSNSVTGPFVGVCRLKKKMTLKSVGFADENVDTFILMLARKDEHKYILEQMGKISISLIEDKKFTETIRLGGIKDLRSSMIRILNGRDN